MVNNFEWFWRWTSLQIVQLTTHLLIFFSLYRNRSLRVNYFDAWKRFTSNRVTAADHNDEALSLWSYRIARRHLNMWKLSTVVNDMRRWHSKKRMFSFWKRVLEYTARTLRISIKYHEQSLMRRTWIVWMAEVVTCRHVNDLLKVRQYF